MFKKLFLAASIAALTQAAVVRVELPGGGK